MGFGFDVSMFFLYGDQDEQPMSNFGLQTVDICVLLCLKIMSYFNFQPKDGSPEPLIPASFPSIPILLGLARLK